MKRKPPAPGRINLARQLVNLRSRYPGGQGEIRCGALTWLDWLRPSPLGRDYLARVHYAPDKPPSSYIIRPSLTELAAGKDLPHVYSQAEGKLCLYLPGCGQWHTRMFIGVTTIPWTILWLYFFEEWLFSGEWKGGGEHPQSPKRRKR